MSAALAVFGAACSDEDDGRDGAESFGDDTGGESPGDGDGDAEGNEMGNEGDGDGDGPGDGDGDGPGDGDGDDGPGDGDGDGDDDPGDGDGDTGDGDGDGDTGDGDGDGDGDTGDGDGDGDCAAPANHVPCDTWGAQVTPLQAIGLNCPGNASNSTQTTAHTWNSPDSQAWQIGRQYGTSGDWVPSEGDQLLVISSGRIPAPNGQGVIVNNGGSTSNSNPDNMQLPAPMSANYGSNNGNGGTPFMACDGVNDCSDSLRAQWQQGNNAANDLLWFDFSVNVPQGTTGWKMDFVYFSNEFPEYVGSTFNDIFVVWEVSESYVGNICFIDGQPCTVTALDQIADAFSGPQEAAHPSLAGTGTQGSGSTGGQTTGWVTIEGPASPNENMELTFAVFDMGDSSWDTMVVMDNWRWNCTGCVPSEVNDCGVQPQ